MLLQHEDLEQIVEYTTGTYRLLFRSLLGSGVVCGLDVSLDNETTPKCFIIKLGIALDCEGYVIEVPKQQTIQFDDFSNLPRFGLVILKRRKPEPCATRGVVCNDGENSALTTREFDGFHIEIVAKTEDEVKKAVALSLNPFNDNECPSNCCIGDGVLLVSFKVNDKKIELNTDSRRSLRKPFEKSKPTKVEQTDEQTAEQTDGETDGQTEGQTEGQTDGTQS